MCMEIIKRNILATFLYIIPTLPYIYLILYYSFNLYPDFISFSNLNKHVRWVGQKPFPFYRLVNGNLNDWLNDYAFK